MARKEGWLETDGRGGYADYPNVGRVYDYDVAKFVEQHLRIRDRLNTKKIAIATIYAQLMLFGVVEMPEEPNFKW